MDGFNTVIWIAGYKDAMRGVHAARYKDNQEYAEIYEAGHAEGSKDRIVAADKEFLKQVEIAKAA